MANTELFLLIFGSSQKNPIVDSLMIFGAEYLIFLMGFLVLLSFFIGKTKEKKAFVLTLLSLGIAFILVKIIRIFYFEPRPFVTLPISPLLKQVPDYSFPSTHTTIAASVAFSFAYYKSKLAPFLIFFMIWIGFARIYVGVHYPLDILGGILVAFASTLLARLLKNFFLKNYR